MKKLLVFVILISCFSTVSFSQSKIQFGVNAEGSWFKPSEKNSNIKNNIKNGFGLGMGVFASRNLIWRLSGDLGAMYRYTEMEKYYQVYDNSGHYGGYGYYSNLRAGWDKLPMHSLALPFHLNIHLIKNLFTRAGVESVWLLNYEIVNKKPEFNWTIGFGSSRDKLSWSVNYIKGFKHQSFGKSKIESDGRYIGSNY